MADIGDLIVRTGRESYSKAKIGLIHRVNYIGWADGSVQYGNYNSINKKHYRRATREEIEQYNTGLRDISKIKAPSIDNYSII